MSDGPSVDSSFAYRKAMEAQGQGGSGAAAILLGARMDTSVKLVDLQSCALIKFDGMIRTAGQRPNGPIAGLLKQMGISGSEIFAGLQKVAQAGPVREASQTDLFGQGGPSGGFVAMSSGRSADDGHGVG